MQIKVLDRYICSIVLKYFFLGFTAFFCLYSFIDLISRLFKFSKSGQDFDLASVGLYYAYAIPDLFSLTSPFIFCLSCFFAIARLQANSQIIAILAAGISIKHITRSLFVISLMLCALLMWLNADWRAIGMRERIIFEKPELFADKTNAYNSSFQDHIEFEDDRFDQYLKFNRFADHIDIENLHLANGTSQHFHATFFDEHMIPRLKLFAKRAHTVNNSQWLKLYQGYVVPITSDLRQMKPESFDEFKIKLKVPLETTRYSETYIQGLKNSELKFFLRNLEAYVEYSFRFIFPLLAPLMYIIAISIALPFVFIKPVYSYFICLISCLMLFFLSLYLKSDAESGYISPITSGIILISVTALIYIFYGRKNLER